MENRKLLGPSSLGGDARCMEEFVGRVGRKSSFTRAQILRCSMELLLIILLAATSVVLLTESSQRNQVLDSHAFRAGSDYNHFVPHGIDAKLAKVVYGISTDVQNRCQLKGGPETIRPRCLPGHSRGFPRSWNVESDTRVLADALPW